MTDAKPDATAAFATSERTRVRREPQLGSYKRADVYAVIDASPLCHIGYVVDGAPYVTPTLLWRKGDRVFWHGSVGSRFLRAAGETSVCVTCTLMDGYVLARSAFNHTINYRSAMLFGNAHTLDGLAAKHDALRAFTDGLFPGRWDSLRPVTEKELKATSVLWMDIDEASVKMRHAPPGDVDDAHVPVWAGVIPLHATLGAAQAAPELPATVGLPESLAALIASGRLR